jgi:hypothetical protein
MSPARTRVALLEVRAASPDARARGFVLMQRRLGTARMYGRVSIRRLQNRSRLAPRGGYAVKHLDGRNIMPRNPHSPPVDPRTLAQLAAVEAARVRGKAQAVTRVRDAKGRLLPKTASPSPWRG